MTDAQLTAGIAAGATAFGAFVTFLKWAFSQWMTDRKEDREERKKEREADRAATIDLTKALTLMTAKFDAFEKNLERVNDAVEHVADEITGNHRIPTRKPPQRADTAPLGGFHGPRRPRQDTP